ncbi:carbohydrate-binding module family 13 protein, partial [Amanita thiersii Skay4041]
WECHNGDNQKWYIEPVEDGYVIRSVFNGKYLGPRGDYTSKTQVMAVDFPFKWTINVSAGDNSISRIYVFGTIRSLDLHIIAPNKSPNGKEVLICRDHGGPNQCWKLDQQSSPISSPPFSSQIQTGVFQ